MSAPGARKVTTTRRKPAPKPPSDAAVAAAVILNERHPAVDAVGIKWLADDCVGYELAVAWSGLYSAPALPDPPPLVAGYQCPIDGNRFFCADAECSLSYRDGTFEDHDVTLVQPVSAP